MPLRKILPYVLNKRLFGDRKKYGLSIVENDEDWKKWIHLSSIFYQENQMSGVGQKVNLASAQSVIGEKLTGKTVFELGPGDLLHMQYWEDVPKQFYIADRSSDMLGRAKSKLDSKKVAYTELSLDSSNFKLNLPDQSIDIVFSFATLEHLYPLEMYLDEFNRVLKPGGMIIGSIPAEGGLAWGFGRFLTTRQWFKTNTKIDPDKIICWEHPNFSEFILGSLDEKFKRVQLNYWPFKVPLLDTNLVIQFRYEKNSDD